MKILVMKFGGTSLSNLEKIKNISKKIKVKLKENKKLIVIVSAMGKSTNDLIRKYSKFSSNFYDEEFDTVVSTGEQICSGLLASYLKKNGIHSRSVLGWQIPIVTDNFHGKSRIKNIEGKKLLKMLNNYQVLVVGGFQGISLEDRITTLGRGGSDTSAVAISVAVKANECEIYTDVEGIFTADPRDVPMAKKIQKITYEEILEMASLGSKVLHPRSVELAMKYGIKIHVRSSFNNKIGTLVLNESKSLEKELVTGISSSDDDAKITMIGIPDNPGVAYRIFNLLSRANLNIDMIVQNITNDGKLTSLTFTVNKNEAKIAENVLKDSKLKFNSIHIDDKICKVSVIGVGMKSHIGVAKKMFETLAKSKINIQVISTSEIKISVLISSVQKKSALQSLHKAYGLDKKNAK